MPEMGAEIIVVFMQSDSYCCPVITKTGICEQSAVKFPSIKFHENSLNGSRVVITGERDKQRNTYMPRYMFEIF
jgi:hypothetical protein